MERYLEIIKYFGIETQQRKLQEEVFELQEAITLHEANKSGEYEIPLCYLVGTEEHITEELADVLILLTQLIAFYDIKKSDLEDKIKYKMERTEKRIKEGYYNK